MQFPDDHFRDDYNLYLFSGGDIIKRKHIEENYNNEDFLVWLCLGAYHEHATKDK